MKYDLLNDDISSLLRKIAFPSMMGMFFNTMYNVTDTYFAGQISTEALSGLSFSFFIYFIFLGLCFGLNSSITALVGNLLGSKRKNKARLYAHNGFSIVFIVAICSAFIGYLTAPYVLSIIGAKGEPLNFAVSYISILFIGTIFMMISFVANAVLVSLGDTKSMRNSLILGFFLNILLNPILIYGYGIIPALGFSGIAISTVIIQFINMGYMLYRVSKFDIVNFKKVEYFFIKLKVIKEILIQALPATLNMLTMSLGQAIITYFVALYGYQAVAGYGIGFRVEQIMLLPALGVSSATLSIISNNYGAKQYERVRECLKQAIIYGFSICAIGVILIALFSKMVIMLFSDIQTIIDYAYSYAVIESFAFFGYVSIFICVSTLQAIKKPNIIVFVSTYRQLIAPLILYFMVAVYFSMPIIYLWFSIFAVTSSAGLFIFIWTWNKLPKKSI